MFTEDDSATMRKAAEWKVAATAGSGQDYDAPTEAIERGASELLATLEHDPMGRAALKRAYLQHEAHQGGGVTVNASDRGRW